jgi:hypothetical protein
MEPLELSTLTAEPLQTVGMMFYFSPQATAEGEKAGLDVVGLYAGGRGGVLGNITPTEVDEIFYFFNPGMIAGAIEGARSKASIEDTVAAHVAAAKAYARDSLGDVDDATLNAFSDAVEALVATLPSGQWPIYDGYRALPVPSNPAERAYHWAIVVRELRGGVHTDVVKAHNLSPLAACQLDRGGAFYGLHGYSDDDKVEETPEIKALRGAVEDDTSRKMAELFETLGDDQRIALANGAIAMNSAITGA